VIPRTAVDACPDLPGQGCHHAAPAATDDAPTSLDASAPLAVLGQLTRAALTFFGIGASLATALQFTVYDKTSTFTSTNAMPASDRRLLLWTALLAGLGACVVPAAYLLWFRTRTAVDKTARAARVLSPGLLSFSLPLLFNWRVFKDEPLLLGCAGALFGLAAERLLRRSLSTRAWDGWLERAAPVKLAFPRASRWIPGGVVTAMVVVFASYFAHYTLLHHYRIQTQSWDLAIFDNLMWNLLRGEWFKAAPDLGRHGSHIQYHANFLAYLFVPFYALKQRAETLLVIQAIVCALGAVPVYLLAVHRLGSRWIGVAFAYAYVVYAPLHGPIFYDFHFLTLAPFFVGWVLYFFETHRRGWLIAAWLAAMLLREDQSAALSLACLFFLVSGFRTRWAFALGILSAAWFVLMKFVVMPAHRTAGADAETFTWMYSGLLPQGESGFGAVLRTILTNPVFVLKSLLVQDKLVYVLKLLVPVLFLPLRNARAWILLLYPAAFTLLTTNYGPTVQTTFQYASNWTSFVFFASMVTLSSWTALPSGRKRILAAVAALVWTSTVMSVHFGALFQQNTFVGGFKRIKFSVSDEDRRNHDDLYALIAQIPHDASVTATETEAPHVSNRADCFTFRFGADDADYLLINADEVRAGNSKRKMEDALKSGKYGLIEARGRFSLWGKGRPTDQNASFAATAFGITLTP
jgi:uncharacterized membrane protein